MDGGAGQTMTEKEQAVGANGSQELTQDDAAPQTVYRVAIKPENPIILSAISYAVILSCNWGNDFTNLRYFS